MHPARTIVLAAALLAAGSAARADAIAWAHAATDAEVDAAFARAKVENKPVFVYWGASWCPPCNQVKATLFNRQDFIKRSRAFVPVYVDGDSPGAQKLGARFKVSGYPTMVLFTPQGTELTRLPGEVEGERYTQVLTLGMAAQRPVKDVLAQALAEPKSLSANDWRLLSFYSWDTGEQQLAPKGRLAPLLQRLANACPADPSDPSDPFDIAMRLRLQALIAADTEHLPPRADAATQSRLLALLAEPSRSRVHLDLLTNSAAEIVRALSTRASAARTTLRSSLDAALQRFEADATLSRADRMQALIARVDLARIDAKENATLQLPEPLLADIREQAARADREITDGYERQAVITAAAYLLEHAGLDADSDALLKANLAKSHSPYYLMSELASNAKKRGDAREALRWYREAFESSTGPATRLQWGASYVNALVELAPREEARIERTASGLFTEAARQPDAFYERSARSLQRIGGKLVAWNAHGAHAAAFGRLQSQLAGVCAALPTAPPADPAPRARCEQVLKPPKPDRA